MTLNSSQTAASVFQKWIRFDVEEVWIAALNSQLGLIEKELLFRGTLNQCLVHPREIFRFLLKSNAAFFIMAHSHPSGNCKPSKSDEKITRQLVKISELIQIPMNDHLILAARGYHSFADEQFLKRVANIDKLTQPLTWKDHAASWEIRTSPSAGESDEHL